MKCRSTRALQELLCVSLLVFGSSAYGLDHPALDALLEQTRSEMDLPGLRAAARLPGGRLVSAAVGFADIEAVIRLDGVLGTPGGSTGKTFVAALHHVARRRRHPVPR